MRVGDEPLITYSCWFFLQIVENTHAAFRANKTKPLAARRQNLLNLDRFMVDHKDDIVQALHDDLAKVDIEPLWPE